MPKKPDYYHPRNMAKRPSGWQLLREREGRANNTQAGYGANWRKLRLMTLAREPLCRMCMANGRTEPATQVDHITPLRQGGTNIAENLQALCARCHMRKTARETQPKLGGIGGQKPRTTRG